MGAAVYRVRRSTEPWQPLDSLTPEKLNVVLVDIAERIAFLLDRDRPDKQVAAPAPPASGGEHTFVCYAREDSEFVLPLASDLKAAGVNVWLDQWDIASGADWDYEIDKALYDCRHFLIVLSPDAVNSEEVRSELRTALNERKRIVPVLYKACRIPRRPTLIQYTDFTSAGADRGAALKQIVQALGLKNP